MLRFRPGTCFLLALLSLQANAVAQRQGSAPNAQETAQGTSPTGDSSAPTVFSHPDAARYFVAGQANIIFQAHAPFHSPYESTNSFLSRGEYKTSLLGTLYLGYQLNPHPRYSTDVIYHEESSGGRGLSEALGLAGFTNLDVVRNPSLGSVPYTARAEVHQVIGFTDRLTDAERTPYSLTTRLPKRRVELWVGKMSLPDLLDINPVGSDSHLQFMNWTTDNNGAWDYAADTRGYTRAVVAQYADQPRRFSARYALAEMPTVANGIDLQSRLARASGQNFELQWDRGIAEFLGPAGVLHDRKGSMRVLGFVNQANMGVYRLQNQAALAAGTTPDITSHAPTRTVKYGVALNLFQEVTENLRLYGRFGWNEGQHESYAYTEVDQTFSGGFDLSARAFSHRKDDKLGVAVVSNAIKRDHQAYLAMGGQGFLLGDGALRYAREDIVEFYYNYSVGHGLYYSFDEQVVAHPGYNAARGPVMVESVRMHVDF